MADYHSSYTESFAHEGQSSPAIDPVRVFAWIGLALFVPLSWLLIALGVRTLIVG
jgi:hypothetical protein